MDAGFAVNVEDEDGNPFLYIAIKKDAFFLSEIQASKNIVQILVDGGADVGARTPGGDPLLYEAVRLGSDAFFSDDIERYEKFVQILIDAGADVNARNADGNPVLYSSFGWSSDIAQILVDAGADVNTRTAGGETLLYEAVRLGSDAFFSSDIARYDRIVQILVEAGAR